MTSFEFVIPTRPHPVAMTVEASTLCAAYLLTHRSLETIRHFIGDVEADGLPMLLLSPLRPTVTPLKPSATHRLDAA
jgi:hypothetical protein